MEASRLLGRFAAVAATILLAVLLVVGATGLVRAASAGAPGAPGEKAIWTPADKDGFGTSTTTASKVWYTLNDGELTEVYYPDLGTPSVRDLQFIVSDGKTFAEREMDATTQSVQLVDKKALEYRQINTDRDGRYRITKTYVTDPGRPSVLVDVTFESLTGEPYQLYAIYDPALNNSGATTPPRAGTVSSWLTTARSRARSWARQGSRRSPAATSARATDGRISRGTT